MGAVGGTLHPHSTERGAGVHRLQPGQRAPEAERQQRGGISMTGTTPKIDTIIQGDCLEMLRAFPDESIDCCVTSPPYFGLRDYGVDGQIGLEPSPEEYVGKLVEVFREVRRVLKKEGTLWLNLGDSYAGSWGNYHPNSPPGKHGQRLKNTARWNRPAYDDKQDFRPPTSNNLSGLKPKDLIGIPWRVAFALQADGWWLRQDIIWSKGNPMPESVTDRCTKSHEYVFLLAKSKKYYYDADAIREPFVYPDRIYNTDTSHQKTASLKEIGNRCTSGLHDGREKYGDPEKGRNKRSVWSINTKPFPQAHFAVMPEALVEPCVMAGCPQNGTVLDPFFGAGTVGAVAKRLGRHFLGIELNPAYIQIATQRLGEIPTRLDRWAEA